MIFGRKQTLPWLSENVGVGKNQLHDCVIKVVVVFQFTRINRYFATENSFVSYRLLKHGSKARILFY